MQSSQSYVAISADQLNTEELVTAFNTTFAGYSLPITQTAESLTAMIETEDIQRQASLVMRNFRGEDIGIGLLAMRGTRGWVGGMASNPDWRRHGLGAWLMTQLLTQARMLHLEMVELEVLEENSAAHRLYLQTGFQDARLLSVFGGPLLELFPNASGDSATPLETPMKHTHVAPIAPLQAMANFETFHQVPAPWQRQQAALRHSAPQLDGLALWTGDAIQAYLLSTRAAQGYVVMDFGSQARFHPQRIRDATRLLQHLLYTNPDASIQVVNVPPGDALGDALTSLGCPIFLRQHEMLIRLT